MNYILETTRQMPYFTSMSLVFAALGISPAEFDWYISDIEVNHFVAGLNCDDHWERGEDLARILAASQDLQFIWAVFSAVAKGSSTFADPVGHPVADGNPDFWIQPELKPQLPGALFEIVSWDSSALLLIGLSDDAIKRFRVTYPDTKPLSTEV